MNSKDFEDKQAILEQISQDHKMRKDQGTSTNTYFIPIDITYKTVTS